MTNIFDGDLATCVATLKQVSQREDWNGISEETRSMFLVLRALTRARPNAWAKFEKSEFKVRKPKGWSKRINPADFCRTVVNDGENCENSSLGAEVVKVSSKQERDIILRQLLFDELIKDKANYEAACNSFGFADLLQRPGSPAGSAPAAAAAAESASAAAAAAEKPEEGPAPAKRSRVASKSKNESEDDSDSDAEMHDGDSDASMGEEDDSDSESNDAASADQAVAPAAPAAEAAAVVSDVASGSTAFADVMDIHRLDSAKPAQDLLQQFTEHHMPKPANVGGTSVALAPAEPVVVARHELPVLNELIRRVGARKTLVDPALEAARDACLPKLKMAVDDYQVNAACQLAMLLTDPDRITDAKALLNMDMGTGKTIMSILAALMVLHLNGKADLGVVLMIAHGPEGASNLHAEIDNCVAGANVCRAKSGGLDDVRDCLREARKMLYEGTVRVFVVLTHQVWWNLKCAAMVRDFMGRYCCVAIVDEIHLNFKDSEKKMAQLMSWWSRLTLHDRHYTIFMTGTPCTKKEDARKLLEGILFFKQMPWACFNDDLVAQAVLWAIQVQVEAPKKVPDNAIYRITTTAPNSQSASDDRYSKHDILRGLHGLKPDDVPSIKCFVLMALRLVSEGFGCVAFVDNKGMIEALRIYLAMFGDQFLFLHGDMRDEDREATMENFVCGGKKKILIVTSAVGGTGLNMVGKDDAGRRVLMVNVVFIITNTHFDDQTVLQISKRGSRLPETAIRGVTFILTNDSAECVSADEIKMKKFKELSTFRRSKPKPTRASAGGGEEACAENCVLTLENAAAVALGLVVAAQNGVVFNPKAAAKCPFRIMRESPFQPPATVEEAKRQVQELAHRMLAWRMPDAASSMPVRPSTPATPRRNPEVMPAALSPEAVSGLLASDAILNYLAVASGSSLAAAGSAEPLPTAAGSAEPLPANDDEQLTSVEEERLEKAIRALASHQSRKSNSTTSSAPGSTFASGGLLSAGSAGGAATETANNDPSHTTNIAEITAMIALCRGS